MTNQVPFCIFKGKKYISQLGELKMFQDIPKNRRYAYARVSSQSQEQNSSLESQKEELMQSLRDRTG